MTGIATAMLRAPLIATAAAWAIARLSWRGELPWWLTLGFARCLLAGMVRLGWWLYDWLPSDEQGLLTLVYFTVFAITATVMVAWSVVSLGRTSLAALQAGHAWQLLPIGWVALALLPSAGRHSLQVACFAQTEWADRAADQKTASAPADSFYLPATFHYDEPSLTLWMHGAYTRGTASRLRQALAANPGARVLGVAGPGGLVHEAEAMSEIIMSRDLDTYAPDRCVSACASVFAAGSYRWIEPGTRIGLHRSGHCCMRDNGPSPLDEHEAAYLRARGVSDWLVDRFLNTPYRQMLVPSQTELIVSGFATHEGRVIARKP